MPCNFPMPAWKTHAGTVVLGTKGQQCIHNRPLPCGTCLGCKHSKAMLIPCGGCAGCRKSKAQAWTLRCLLEMQDHKHATFTTLTYHENCLPDTLQRRDLQLFLKRLRRRKSDRFRFFACGEYGEERHRPHYHAILFGISATEDAGRIQMAWNQGFTTNEQVTPERIAYTAGYVQKKYDQPTPLNAEYINYTTGEVYQWQKPFIQMSRGGRTGHGIGGNARHHTASWRDFAVMNGTRMPVPKYLHEAWKQASTEEEKENREHEHYLRKLTKERITRERLDAQEAIQIASNELQAQKRHY